MYSLQLFALYELEKAESPPTIVISPLSEKVCVCVLAVCVHASGSWSELAGEPWGATSPGRINSWWWQQEVRTRKNISTAACSFHHCSRILWSKRRRWQLHVELCRFLYRLVWFLQGHFSITLSEQKQDLKTFLCGLTLFVDDLFTMRSHIRRGRVMHCWNFQDW